MARITTSNSLTDFDMCLALAQSAINSQLRDAWKIWKAKRNFSDTIRVFKFEESGAIKDSKFGIEATIAPLEVNLNLDENRGTQVEVTLRLESGRVLYLDPEEAKPAEHPISNWTIPFAADLEKQPVDLAALKAIDPDAAKTAATVVTRAGLDESVFSIEYLFLKLTDIELLLVDNKRIGMPVNTPSGARTRALTALNVLLHHDLGRFVLGTVVRRNTKQAAPTFALTDFFFDRSRNEAAPAAATLDYLGMMSGRPMPPVRAKLRGGWIRPEQIDGRESSVSGVMAITGRLFLEQYLIPKFQQALTRVDWQSVLGTAGVSRPVGDPGPTPTRNGLTWTFAESVTTSTNLPETIGTLTLTLIQSYSLTVQALPSTSPQQIAISGRIDCKVHIDGSFLDVKTQYIHVEGHQDVTGGIALTGSGIGTAFELKSVLAYQFKDPVQDKNESGGAIPTLAVFGDIAKSVGLMAKTPAELLVSVQNRTAEKLMQTLKAALGRLDMDLNQHTFIPPGGGVFTFQNPCFSNAGDLFMDVIYRRT